MLMEQDVNNRVLQDLLASAFKKRGDYKEAIEFWNTLVEHNSSNQGLREQWHLQG